MPDKKKRSRAAEIEATDGRDSPRLELPELGVAQYLAEYLFEVGPDTGGNRLEWGELEAWQRQTGVELSEFGATVLIELSGEFLHALHAARADIPPPCAPTQAATPADATAKIRARRATAGKTKR